MELTKEQARAVMEVGHGYNIDNMAEHKKVALAAWGDQNDKDGAYARGLAVIADPVKVQEWLKNEVDRGTPPIEAAAAAAVIVGEIIDYLGQTMTNPKYVWAYMGKIINKVLAHSAEHLDDPPPGRAALN